MFKIIEHSLLAEYELEVFFDFLSNKSIPLSASIINELHCKNYLTFNDKGWRIATPTGVLAAYRQLYKPKQLERKFQELLFSENPSLRSAAALYFKEQEHD